VRVVIADDSRLLREGIASLVRGEGIEVVAQAAAPDELLAAVDEHEPDVAIVDIRMPPTQTDEGLQAAKEIREKHPETAVLVLSQYVESGYALELLQKSAEGVGYLLKDRVSDIDDFAAAVRRVAEGGSALDPSVVSQLVGRRRRDDPLATLTAREREVLELMAEGLSNAAIAARIVVTERAVEKHVTNIFQKLRLPTAPETHRRVLAVLATCAPNSGGGSRWDIPHRASGPLPPGVDRSFQEADQLSDRPVVVARVPERELLVDLVVVPAPVAGLRQVADAFQLVDDLGGRPLRDSRPLRDVAQADGGVGGDRLQHPRVVGQERPALQLIT